MSLRSKKLSILMWTRIMMMTKEDVFDFLFLN